MGDDRRDFIGVVVAGGGATRFGGSVPKQFLELGSGSVLDRAVRSLVRPGVGGVVVVLPGDARGGAQETELRHRAEVLDVVTGGASRAESVRFGLEAAAQAAYVLVHDAARPLASPGLVDAVIEATRRHGAAVPGLPVPDTVKQVGVEGGVTWVERTVDRGGLRLAQTPQGARTDWLRQALERARREGRQLTDEASALEADGHRVAVVPGEAENRKITTPRDLEAARRAVGGGASSLRVGTGFDVHTFGENRRLVLGGVEFTGEPGLAGHSDADVVLHAAMDAMLGAAALGDIGALFPPDDPAFAGADSRRLASEVADRVRAAGFELLNLDLTLLAERPKIRTRVDEMRGVIAACLGVAVERVGLKATTLEGMGALGRGEGIGCQASALLARAADA